MKTSLQKLMKVVFLCSIFLSLFSAYAQAPNKMSYQAVIRDATNVLVSNANVGVKISILQTTSSGTVLYSETHTPTTNANGLVTLEIGGGTILTGNFATINWANGPYFIKTETDPIGGSNYTISGTSQLLSVPFALYAASSGSSTSNWTTTGTNIANNNSGNVGIGTGATIPSSLLTVKKDGIGFTQEDTTGASRIGFFTNQSDAWIQTHSNTDLSFATNNGATQMILQKATGNLGIGGIVPTEKLEVAGKTKTTNLQVTSNSGAGKVLTSDATGNAIWTTPVAPVENVFIKKSFGISTSAQGSIVDLPLSNYTVVTSGYYLITYFTNAYNTWYLNCSEPCTAPKVVNTTVYLYNKTSGAILQNQKIDFLNRNNTSAAEALVNTFLYELPSHEVSGSFAYYLNAGDIIGLRIGSVVSAPGAIGTIVGSGEVTFIRLY